MPDKEIVIIGGGISGLSALHFVKRSVPELSVTLYESDNRLGGTIGTDKVDGYSFDWGPNGFLDREPLTLQLCDEIGLSDDLERAGESVKKRFILRKGNLRTIPLGPLQFLTSNVLSVRGKVRLLMEPFAKPRADINDESIYDFAKRRIGKEAADYLVQPMVSGIFGGMAERLSLESCFPIMSEMEKEYGSLIKAMVAKARKSKKNSKRVGITGSPGGPAGWLTSFSGGLYSLVEKLEKHYSDDIVKDANIESITRDSDYYRVKIKNGGTVSANCIIIATPSGIAANLVMELSNSLSENLNAIPYAPIAVICLGYEEEKVSLDLDGFGFLVPAKENRRILGSIWTSSIFSGRAPAHHVQFRTMIGGDGDRESMHLLGDELKEAAIHDLAEIVGLKGDPDICRIYRWDKGIPQYKIGHSKIMSHIDNEIDKLGNIYLAGNAYSGVGLNDCINRSYQIVNSITHNSSS